MALFYSIYLAFSFFYLLAPSLAWAERRDSRSLVPSLSVSFSLWIPFSIITVFPPSPSSSPRVVIASEFKVECTWEHSLKLYLPCIREYMACGCKSLGSKSGALVDTILNSLIGFKRLSAQASPRRFRSHFTSFSSDSSEAALLDSRP
ncbi:hypothetical protein IE53DRAFT_54818 [Violaceomyces palustris]|uniref:Uncharacterized protein n=1 Tax=Violaceomyces palustris TaxID=1673888 RepID=A0ACD0NZR8_9BASI|nr:hypothetical protein IE53DRAFT_54818 [Violaceomyces palustris]